MEKYGDEGREARTASLHGWLFSDLTERYRTLFNNHHFLDCGVGTGLQPIEVHTTAHARCVPINTVRARFPLTIHHASNFSAKDVEHLQPNEGSYGQLERQSRHGIEGIRIVLQ